MANKKVKKKNMAGLGLSKYNIDTNGVITDKKSDTVLSTHVNNAGYLRCSLTHDKDGKQNYLVHVLVADMFIPNPKNLPDVDHIDNDKTNPKVSNLKRMNHSANVKKAMRLMKKAK